MVVPFPNVDLVLLAGVDVGRDGIAEAWLVETASACVLNAPQVILPRTDLQVAVPERKGPAKERVTHQSMMALREDGMWGNWYGLEP